MFGDNTLWDALKTNGNYYGNGNYMVSPEEYRLRGDGNWRDYFDQFTWPMEPVLRKKYKRQYDDLKFDVSYKFEKLERVLDIYQPDMKESVLKGLTGRNLIWDHIWVGGDERLGAYVKELEERSDNFIRTIIDYIRAPLDIIYVLGEDHRIIEDVKHLFETFYSLENRKRKEMLVTIIYKKYLPLLFKISHSILDQAIKQYDEEDSAKEWDFYHRSKKPKCEDIWIPRDDGKFI